ncbi:MAG TPA: PH domain-containing protein [Lacunisphaera sp.]|nr:PH domain-containing protein [Lacunisphaera sp.]
MYQRITLLLLKWLRVPPEPQPPHGDPASLRVFRAGKNFLNLRLIKWGAAQVGAMIGIIFWFGVFSDLETKVEEERRRRNQPKPAAAAPVSPAAMTSSPPPEGAVAPAEAPSTESKPPDRRIKRKWRPYNGFLAWQHGTAAFLSQLPRPAMLVIWFFEVAGFALYILQLPLTFLLARMDYDLRWYLVTDRSLRIRHGVWKISESTMSFANIQQVVVSQGPLQRLLGLSDVKVQSAGGGGGEKEEEQGSDDMHVGLFHSVTNPAEIRDLIQDRLRRFRESGLGDPDEKTQPLAALTAETSVDTADLLQAAAELAAEARALRASL